MCLEQVRFFSVKCLLLLLKWRVAFQQSFHVGVSLRSFHFTPQYYKLLKSQTQSFKLHAVIPARCLPAWPNASDRKDPETCSPSFRDPSFLAAFSLGSLGFSPSQKETSTATPSPKFGTQSARRTVADSKLNSPKMRI